MIAVLRFGPVQGGPDGRALRHARFERRSTLPLSAECVVANGVREQLVRLLALELEVELVEPVVPTAQERRVLLEGALVYRVRGRTCDAFVVVRPLDARRLVALAFREVERSEGDALSEIERTTLERIVAALVPLCASLCGTLGPVTAQTPERAAGDIATYFEARTVAPPRVAVGFALTRDPVEEVGARLSLDDLAEIELCGSVAFGGGEIGVSAFSRLRAGTTLALETPLGAQGILRFGGVAFARGTCGARGERGAFLVGGTAA